MQAVQHCSDMCRLLKARILSCSWQPITSPRWNSYLHFLLPSNEQWNVFPLPCRHDDDRSMFMSKREKCCWYQLLYKSRLPGRTKLAQRSPPVTACTEPGSNISARWADKTFSSGLDTNSYQTTIFYQKKNFAVLLFCPGGQWAPHHACRGRNWGKQDQSQAGTSWDWALLCTQEL